VLRHGANVAEQVAVVGRVLVLHVRLEVAVERQVRALPQRAAAWSRRGCAGCGVYRGAQGARRARRSAARRGAATAAMQVGENQARHYSKGSSERPRARKRADGNGSAGRAPT